MRNKVITLIIVSQMLLGCTGENDAWPSRWLSGSQVTVYENHQGVAYQAELSRSNGETIAFRIEGVDAALFTVNPQTGAIQFKEPPDFEAPKDDMQDNRYRLKVIGDNAISGKQLTALDISIIVKNAEPLSATQFFPLPNSYVEPNSNGIVPLTVSFEGQGAPIFYPDEWQINDPEVTRFFKYYAFGIEPSYSEDLIASFLDPHQYANPNLPLLKAYLDRRFNTNIIKPALLDYGYTVNPSQKIAITFAGVTDQNQQIELEWTLQDQLNDDSLPVGELPDQIAVSDNAIYLASKHKVWQLTREGKHVTQVFSSVDTTVEKISVIYGRTLMVLHDEVARTWHLHEWTSDSELVELYQLPMFDQQLLGADFDLEILEMDSAYEVVFLPNDLCNVENDVAVEPALYRLSASGIIVDTSLLTNSAQPIFNCQNGRLVDRNLSFDLQYTSPKLSYTATENTLLYWGRSFTEDNINGVTMSSGPTSVTIGTQYWFDETADYISNFKHYARYFEKRKSFYLMDGGLYIADGNIDATSTRLTSWDYQVHTYAVDPVADLIYSVGLWGNAQAPVLAVHHIYSGATSYVPLP